MLLPSLLLALLLPGPVRGAGDPPVKYKLESKNTIVMDLSSVGQGSQEIATSMVAFLTLTMSDTTGGRMAHVVVDSGKFDGGEMMAMLPDSMTKVKPGTAFHFLIKNGKVDNSLTPQEMGAEGVNMTTSQILPAMMMLFPSQGRTLTVGTTWVDTNKVDTTVTTGTDGSTAHTNTASITTWTVSGKSGDDFLLDAALTGTTLIAVMGNEVQGKVTGTERLTVSPAGVVRTATGENRTQMTMAMGANSIETSVVQSTTVVALP
ncbi:MAG: hypothetical protein V4503_06655 [Gemmatimonadota bacterium]